MPAPAIARDVATVVEQPSNLTGYDVVRPRTLDSKHAMPVIVWADGGCVRYDGLWLPILKRWAAAGFVVVAIGTPPGGNPQTLPVSTVDDQAKAINWAEAENARSGSPYQGRLDTTRIVAAGNSCGGITTLSLAARDPRVRAVFVLSGSSVLPGAPAAAAAKIMSAIHVPIGFVVGGPQDISRTNARQDYHLITSGQPAMFASRATGDHLTVSTKQPELTEDAEISTDWIDYAINANPQSLERLRHNPCSTCPAGTWTIELKNIHD